MQEVKEWLQQPHGTQEELIYSPQRADCPMFRSAHELERGRNTNLGAIRCLTSQ